MVLVGARAAGAATAMLLARAGMSVLVLERDRPGTDTLSTHALMRCGVSQLARWGLLDAVIRAGTPPITTATFRYAHDDVTIPIKPAGGVAALYAPRRTVLDPILVDSAKKAGAQVRFKVAATGLLWDHGRVIGVRTVTRSSRGRRSNSSRSGDCEAHVYADLVIGADGRNSLVARLVEAPTTHRAEHTSAFCYAYYAGLAGGGYEWAYRPGAAAGLIPTNSDLTCVFAGGTPGRIGRGGAAALTGVLRAASPEMAERLARARRCGPVRTFTGQPGYLRRPHGPGWALVGDAGSWKDPISAHGLTDALRDAELLAGAIIDRRGAAGLADYEALRNRLSLPIMRASDEIAAMGWDEARIQALLAELNLAMNAELLAMERA